MTKRFAVGAVGVVALLVSSCGGSSSTAPTGVFAQVAGNWSGTVQVHGFGGDVLCITALPVGINFPAAPVAMNTTAQFSQSGGTVTASVTNTANGTVTNYSGTAGTDNITLNFKDCNLCAVRSATCSNGAVRDLTPQSGTFTAMVSGSTMTGTAITTYNVTDSSTGAVVDSLIVTANVSATKQ